GADVTSRQFNVSFTVAAAPTQYEITISPAGNKNFGSATAGYTTVPTHSITVNNTGVQPTGALNIVLSGANAGSFTLNKNSITNIAAGGNDSFTVKPNMGLAAGTYNATVTVSGRAEITARSFNVSFTVTAAASVIAPTVTTSSLPEGTVGRAYSRTLGANGTKPITWSLDSGSQPLPYGLSLSSAGLISGMPTTAGIFSFTVRAANSAGDDTKSLSIVIKPASSGGGEEGGGGCSTAAGLLMLLPMLSLLVFRRKQ
ncbi:MAG: putative Ig domain-containing protein, partial [Synergistaceae bacterium]|nr:putative Ig domain-containing protein [Synergistaceae bacterium]